MARPKKDPNTASAAERIENAFWDMLEEGPYSDITIVSLAKRAEVNHNTIYYYYENIDDLAISLFEKNLIPEMPSLLISSLTIDGFDLQSYYLYPDIIKRLKKNRLFARGDSPFLLNHLKQRFIQIWLQNAGIRQEELPKENRLELEFIFSGLISILGSSVVEEDLSIIPALLKRNFFRNILITLGQLAHKE